MADAQDQAQAQNLILKYKTKLWPNQLVAYISAGWKGHFVADFPAEISIKCGNIYIVAQCHICHATLSRVP